MPITTQEKRTIKGTKKQVGFFVTCLVDFLRPSVGFNCLKILETQGFEIVVPLTQSCCGQPAYNSGDKNLAKTIALQIVDSFNQCDYIVVPSGSCAAMMRKHYTSLAKHSSTQYELFSAFAKKIYEFTDFLYHFCNYQHPPSCANETSVKHIIFHDSCSSLRELGIKDSPRKLLQKLPHVSLVENSDPESCCGFGGVFCVKFSDISAKMSQEKATHILNSKASCLTSTDLGCLINIAGTLRKKGENLEIRHIAEILANDKTSPSI